MLLRSIFLLVLTLLLAPRELSAEGDFDVCPELLNWRDSPREIDRGPEHYLDVIDGCTRYAGLLSVSETKVVRNQLRFPIDWWQLPITQSLIDDGRLSHGWSHTSYEFEIGFGCAVSLHTTTLVPQLLRYEYTPLFIRDEYDRMLKAIHEYEATLVVLLERRLRDIVVNGCSEDWGAHSDRWIAETERVTALTRDGKKWGVHFAVD